MLNKDICNFTSWYASFALLAWSCVGGINPNHIRIQGFGRWGGRQLASWGVKKWGGWEQCVTKYSKAIFFREFVDWIFIQLLRLMSQSRVSITWTSWILWRCTTTVVYKLCLKVIDHSSGATWGQGPSGYRLQIQQYDLPPLKQGYPTAFVL
jgi:hypothetical protein